MKYIRLFESKIFTLSIDVSLFPNHKGLKEYEEPTTGTWTSFCSYSNDEGIGKKLYNIIWRKYLGTDDPCEKSDLGPCRPEFESYPHELANLLIYIGEFVKLTEKEKEGNLEISKNRKYWKYSNGTSPIYDGNDEVKLTLYFNSKKDVLEWLDVFEDALNEPEIKERITDYMMAKKYNL